MLQKKRNWQYNYGIIKPNKRWDIPNIQNSEFRIYLFFNVIIIKKL